jgi:hypothetical protein
MEYQGGCRGCVIIVEMLELLNTTYEGEVEGKVAEKEGEGTPDDEWSVHLRTGKPKRADHSASSTSRPTKSFNRKRVVKRPWPRASLPRDRLVSFLRSIPNRVSEHVSIRDPDKKTPTHV